MIHALKAAVLPAVCGLLAAVFASTAHAQLVTVTDDHTAALNDKVEGGPWTSLKSQSDDAPALYVWHLRSCGYCRLFDKQERDALLAKGIDIRLFAFPARSETDNDLAHLAYERDPAIFKTYMRGRSINAPSMRSSQARIDAYNASLDALNVANAVMEAATGRRIVTPGFAYKDETGQWYMLHGYSAEWFTPMRKLLHERVADQSEAAQ